ncbi:hypothetical protein [Candidatus Enterococcus courvalinii]|uniref:Uncharacterized protein n=1 Tax=Candidatus Enterococcus courvalinii TaxID=2815329 RepID=A0ABS3HY37_9ENTE|nr:hypothetical protein [Enterococcus sp. MSG2901]MBO0481389.1 hypothetical protein [Enterococcus sp. MSG2901]
MGMEMKNINVYRVGFCSQRKGGGLLHLERAFAFEPEMTELEIKTVLLTRMGRILAIEYIDEIERDVIYW